MNTVTGQWGSDPCLPSLPDGYVRVCAWCHPNAAAFYARFPHLRGYPVTHTICERHKAEALGHLSADMRQDFDRQKADLTLV
jgi:hypothetical protein